MIFSILIKFLTAHMIGDFLLQPDSWVLDKKEKKERSKYLYFHIIIHLAALLTLFQLQHIFAIFILVISHYFIDLIKLYLVNDANKRVLFVADQIAHIAVILLISYVLQPFTLHPEIIFNDQVLLLIGFLIFVSYTCSTLIKFTIAPWDKKINSDEKSIDGAGKLIGILERLFVFGFVLLDTWSAIGFLITAKSVFRFGDLNEGKNRKLTEYVLIGTLLSFGLAILSALLYKYIAGFLM